MTRAAHAVGAARIDAAFYSESAPYHPADAVPECPFPERAQGRNPAYEGVREAFVRLGLDAARQGTAAWNPLGALVRPGDTVLLKPNFVVDVHPRDPKGLAYTITHGSVIRAVADYVAIALAGSGRIVVADAPQTDSSFSRIVAATGLESIRAFYASKGVDFAIVDLRAEEWTNEGGVIVARTPLPGDPRGYSVADIGADSAFYGYQGEGRYYGADYDTEFVNAQHKGRTHRYCLANTALDCDVFINLPKLKTHKKGGVTASLKNLVGINGDKNYLPHHTVGSPQNGGDQFPDARAGGLVEQSVGSGLRRLSLAVPAIGTPLLRVARKIGARIFGSGPAKVRSGNWHGNDTVWRMTLDMNRILLYWDPVRRVVDPTRKPKRYLSVVDAIIGGDGNGPMDPDAKPAGTIVAGDNAAAVDATCAVLMGFDPSRLATVQNAFVPHPLPIGAGDWRHVVVHSNHAAWNLPLGAIGVAESLGFAPHPAWRGHLERRDPPPVAV